MKNTVVIFCILALCSFDLAIADQNQPTEAEVLAQLQIGPNWDKVEVDANYLQKLPRKLSQAARSIANFKHGTAFYLGNLNGKYIMATNAHVAANSISDLLPDVINKLTDDPSLICRSRRGGDARIEQVRFGLQKKSFECDQLIGVWPSIELALFTIKVEPADSNFFAEIGLHFDFSNPIQGSELKMFGYGEFMNPGQPDISLMAADGTFCRTFSRTGEFHFMNDPDEHNPGPYKVWSFAVGCNIAWGDSGSPLLDSKSGHAVGLIWTARYPKGSPIIDPVFLNRIAVEQSQEVWTQLSYGSPAPKIRDILKAELALGHLNQLQAGAIRMILRDTEMRD